MFILLNLPLEISLLLPTKYLLNFNIEFYVFFSYVFNSSSAINFYLILLTNSLFRQEFISLFIKGNQNQTLDSPQNRQIIELKHKKEAF